ncbi:MAG: hypothetical protein LBK61_04775 [Spirochaetaceae bacterium]|nr:hypothetical protein [Spirochaetaceae bacterium]
MPLRGRKPYGFSSLCEPFPILAEDQRGQAEHPLMAAVLPPSGAQCRHKGVFCLPRTMPD